MQADQPNVAGLAHIRIVSKEKADVVGGVVVLGPDGSAVTKVIDEASLNRRIGGSPITHLNRQRCCRSNFAT